MSIQQILDVIRSLDGVLVLAPGEGSEFPEVAWGDYFVYYAPDGQVPTNRQPYATIVTKNYPGDGLSDLGGGRWRLNIHAGRGRFTELTGEDPGEQGSRDFAETDVFLPHPVYRSLAWVAVVNPADRTLAAAIELLRAAHQDERDRVARRAQSGNQGPAA